MRRVLLVVASAPLLACSPALRRPVTTTEAATDMQQVTRSHTNEIDPAISPDAKEIAYEVADSPQAAPHVEVMALAQIGTDPTRPAYSSKDAMGREPAWKPDGSGLIFVSDALGARSLVQTIGPSPERTAFLGAAGNPNLFAAWPAVSPDGTMAMSLGRADLFRSGWQRAVTMESALGLSDQVGSGVTVLGEGTDPAWSPHGKRLAFVRVTDDHHTHVFVSNPDGAGTLQITDGPDDDMNPSWSPDGRFVAFCTAHPLGDGTTSANLFVVRPDGSRLEQLTEGDRVACRPAWGRDGYVYFHANANDRFHIWRIRPSGTLAAP